MNCPHCGAPLAAEAESCEYCGCENERFVEPRSFDAPLSPIIQSMLPVMLPGILASWAFGRLRR